MKKSVIEKVEKFTTSNARLPDLKVVDMNEIVQAGNLIDIIRIAFYFGYMKGCKTKKGGAK